MNRWVRAGLIAVALAITVVVLFTWVFPWVERALVTDPTMTSWV